MGQGADARAPLACWELAGSRRVWAWAVGVCSVLAHHGDQHVEEQDHPNNQVELEHEGRDGVLLGLGALDLLRHGGHAEQVLDQRDRVRLEVALLDGALEAHAAGGGGDRLEHPIEEEGEREAEGNGESEHQEDGDVVEHA
jgi:hypothetical protein